MTTDPEFAALNHVAYAEPPEVVSDRLASMAPVAILRTPRDEAAGRFTFFGLYTGWACGSDRPFDFAAELAAAGNETG